MLGFAFSEAQRSEQLMLRLQQQKAASLAKAGAAGSKPAGQKRRRRRRAKKPYGFGGSSTSTSTTPSTRSSGTTASSHRLLMSAGASAASTATPPKQHDAPMTKRDLYFALRCGMVNVGPRPTDTAVGRVTLVNWENEIVLDTFVKVPVPVTNYRTEVTGITPGLLEHGACSLDSVRKKVGSLIRGKILIGHGLEVDLAALRLTHPWCDMRDTATYAPYMQQIMDPLTRMLLPRTLEDLMQHELFPAEPAAAEQPNLVSEAVACVALYKKVREPWENELVKVMQQKDRQREMMLNMRGAAALPAPPALSRIAEDASGDEFAPPITTTPYPGPLVENDPERRYSREWLEYETSTLASDVQTLDNYEAYREDDMSDTSSLDGSLRRPRPIESEMDLNPMFENLHLLPQFRAHAYDRSLDNTFGSSTAAGSGVEEWTYPSGGRSNSHHSGIWNPLDPSTAVSSVTNGDWTQESTGAGNMLPAVASPPGDDPVKQTRSAETHNLPVSLTEEELMEHLPAHLLDDIDGKSSGEPQVMTSTADIKDVAEEPKKKSWFSLGRRRRSASVTSTPGEASFAEMKAGSKLSLSDRIPRRSKLLSDDSLDSSSKTGGSHGNSFFHRATKPPPGF